jgi:hypothetical protein
MMLARGGVETLSPGAIMGGALLVGIVILLVALKAQAWWEGRQ